MVINVLIIITPCNEILFAVSILKTLLKIALYVESIENTRILFRKVAVIIMTRKRNIRASISKEPHKRGLGFQ